MKNNNKLKEIQFNTFVVPSVVANKGQDSL